MTENEAKEWIKYLGNQNLPYDRSPKSRKLACDIAIQALEEIQQYRAIGTVEELQKLKLLFGNENVEISELTTKILKEYPEYLSIGTIEEFKALKEKETEILLKDGQLLYQQGLVDGYAKAIDEFAETLNKKISEFVLEHKDNLDFASGISVAWNMVDEIAEQLKAGGIDG